MDWFRMYSEARNDAKLRTLPAEQFRIWFNLLCFAAEGEGERRGTVDASDADLLAVEVANGDVELLRDTIARLERLKILSRRADGATLLFCRFKDRQYDKPSDRPERVRERVAKHRDTRRNAPTNEATPRKRDVTPSNALYTDTESDTETESPLPYGRGAPGKPDAPAPLALVEPVRLPRGEGDEHRALWLAFQETMGEARTQTERNRRGKACKELREGGYTPAELLRAIENWPNVMGDATLSEMGLVANMAKLLHGPQVNGRHNGTTTQYRQSLTETALVSRGESLEAARTRRQLEANRAN